jgi:hypothetical protein
MQIASNYNNLNIHVVCIFVLFVEMGNYLNYFAQVEKNVSVRNVQ